MPDPGFAATSLLAGSPTSRIFGGLAFCSFSRLALGLDLLRGFAFCLCGSLHLRDPGSFSLCLLGRFALDLAGGFTLRLLRRLVRDPRGQRAALANPYCVLVRARTPACRAPRCHPAFRGRT